MNRLDFNFAYQFENSKILLSELNEINECLAKSLLRITETTVPKFITFTGVDERTDVEKLAEITRRYPVEWGVLFGNLDRGNRYTGIEKAHEISKRYPGILLSAHLCGKFAREVLNTGRSSLDLSIFKRIQINAIDYNLDNLSEFANYHDQEVIMQIRSNDFPEKTIMNVTYLHDKSGGKGIETRIFPSHSHAKLVGYAGGIGPDNVVDVISRINALNFYIDMESKIRTDDWLDLDKCLKVCELVYDKTL